MLLRKATAIKIAITNSGSSLCLTDLVQAVVTYNKPPVDAKQIP